MILLISLTSVACTNTPASSSSSSGSGSNSTSEKPQVKSEVTMLGASTDYTMDDYWSATEAQSLSVSPSTYALANEVATYAPKTPDVKNNYSVVSTEGPVVEEPSQDTDNMIYVFYTILLDNPKDHYIMDFKFNCNVDGALIRFVDGHSESLNTGRRVRWDQAYLRSGNTFASFNLFFPRDAKSVEVTITDLYYSDHDDGTNKTLADTTEHGTFKLYIVDGYINFDEETVEDNADYNRIFKIGKGKDALIFSIKINGVEIKYENDTFYYNVVRNEENPEEIEIEIDYSYNFDFPEWNGQKKHFTFRNNIW